MRTDEGFLSFGLANIEPAEAAATRVGTDIGFSKPLRVSQGRTRRERARATACEGQEAVRTLSGTTL
jgi:hypothetical protein